MRPVEHALRLPGSLLWHWPRELGAVRAEPFGIVCSQSVPGRGVKGILDRAGATALATASTVKRSAVRALLQKAACVDIFRPVCAGRSPCAHYTVNMLWVKAFHIVFIASWFAGLFYLPRIFVNLAMVPPESVAERERLLLMAGKLYRFMTLLAVPALALGIWLWLGYGIGLGAGSGWMHGKLLVVLLLLGYHHACGRMLRQFRAGHNRRHHVWYRWFNEAPVLLMVIAVALVVVKPF